MDNRLYKYALWAGLAAIIFFTPVARGGVRIWSVTPVMFMESVLIFAWLWKANNQKGYIFKKTAIDLPVAIFAIFASLSFIFSVYKHDSFYCLLQFFGYVGIYYLVVNEFDHAMRKRLLLVVACAGASISLYGLLQYFGFLSHEWWFPQNFLSATYVNHNHFAGFLELAIPITVGMLMNSRLKTQKSKLFLILALVIMVAAFILSQSRGAWFSLIISFFAIGIIITKRISFSAQDVFIIVIILFIITSFLYFGKDIISSRMNSLSVMRTDEVSMQTRFRIWKGCVGMIRVRPLTGAGIGDFIWAFPRFRPEGLNVQANAAHNDYLQAAAEMGLAALFVMIWVLAALIGSAVKNGYADPIKMGCAIGLLSLSLHGLVDFNFHITANMLLFTVCAAVAASTSRSNGESE